jgi:DNA-binding NtrC family response regulator
VRGAILLVDDDPVFRATMSALLSDEGYAVSSVTTGAEALDMVRARPFDLVISDIRMPGMSGLELLPEILSLRPDLLVLMVTGYATIENAIDAMRHGAFDFVRKPCPHDEFLLKVERAIERARADAERLLLRAQLDELAGFGRIVGKSAAIRHVLHMVRQVAETDSTVLVRGETGTGKELVARAIHDLSARADRPFVAVNCAALTETLLESEFFGHERGAFTGAVKQRRGKFELANGGTLFLDEIGDISAATQLRLLRVLQERTFERVGGTETIETDVRIIAATNKDLETAVTASSFRSDLFYRLNVFPIYLPPVRERMDDVPALALALLERTRARLGKDLHGFSEQALAALLRHTWPGNVRELENVIHRAAITASGPVIDHVDITPAPGRVNADLPPFAPPAESLTDVPLRVLTRRAIEDIEARYLREGLKRFHGNVSKLAHAAGLDRRSIFEKMRRYKLRREDYRRDARSE